MVKVTVNKETCIACGVCWSIAPQIFELDTSTGKTRIKEPYRTTDSETESVGEIPENLKDLAEKAASNCPVGAISIG